MVVDDKVVFVREVIANGTRLASAVCLICYFACAETTQCFKWAQN